MQFWKIGGAARITCDSWKITVPGTLQELMG